MRGLRHECLVAVVFLSALAPAQQYSGERHRLLPPVSVPAVSGASYDAASGDFDGDGDVDLAWNEVTFASFFGSILRMAANDGEGRFTSMTSVPIGAPFTTPPFTFGDIDGDGDLDLAVGGVIGAGIGVHPGRLYANDGAFVFTDVSWQWPTTSESTVSIRFVDWDRDGDMDILTCDAFVGLAMPVGMPQPINRLYLNDGTGVFTDVTAARMVNTSTSNKGMMVGDLDGDADPDIVVWTSNGTTAYVQNAQGQAIQTSGLFPASAVFKDATLIDHDLDGDLDLAGAAAQGILIFSNNGVGVFSLAAILPDTLAARLTPADIDGDGRIDLLATRQDSGGAAPLRLYLCTASGLVDATARIEAPWLSPSVITAFDCDGDGDNDLWGSTSPQAVLWHNDGNGSLLQVTSHELSATRSVFAAAADLEPDGDFDVALVEQSAIFGRVVVAANPGSGPDTETVTVVPWTAADPPRSVAWVDADLDGDQDLFVGRRTGMKLFHAVNGGFVDVTATHLPAGLGGSRAAVGDLDGDGIADLVTSFGSLLRGDGVGGFANFGSLLPPITYEACPVLLDYDHDGDLDIAQAPVTAGGVGGGAFRLLQNNWPLPFVDVTASLGLPAIQAWAIGSIDIDRDGRTDLLVGNSAPGSNGVLLLRSVGTGFVDETATRVAAIQPVGSICVLDFDGDGWDDVATRDRWGNSPADGVNTNGVLVFWSPLHDGPVPPQTVAADFDGDGDQDLIQTYGLLRNRARDLQNALPPRLGMNAQLVLHAYAGDGVNPQAVLLMISTQLAAPPVATPFGTLCLDPATTGIHSSHLIPGYGGEAIVNYSVLAQPSLLGSVVYAQAGFVHQANPATWRLGNCVKLEVRL